MLQNILNKFLKKEEGSNSESSYSSSNFPVQHSWYSDRYETVLIQRNFLMALTIFAFVGVVVAIFVVGKISTSKTFSPFVIQIEERTGSAKVVNPADSSLLSGNEALSRYFIKKYVIARETYNPVDYELNSKKIVRLFSTQDVYRAFWGIIKKNDPTVIYGQKNTTYLRIRSFTKLADQFFVRFSIIETAGEQRVFNKIATIEIDYVAMELTEEERDINPVGFQITGYRVDDDNS